MDDLFADLPSALIVLKDKYRYEIGSNGICNDLNKYYVMLNDLDIWYNNRNEKTYIPRLTVIEGLDGSGKSTVVSQIANVLEIKERNTPAKSLSFVRDYIDGHRDPIIRRAFYMMSNYMLVKEMTEECEYACKNLHFVIDRYYPSFSYHFFTINIILIIIITILILSFHHYYYLRQHVLTLSIITILIISF